MALPPLPLSADVAAYLQPDGDGAVLAVPVRDFRVQAVLVLVLLPVVWALLALLFALALPPDAAAVLGGALVCLGTAFSTLAGGVMLLRARGQSERSRVHVGADRSVRLAGGQVLRPDMVYGLRVRQPNPMMKWIGILAFNGESEVLILGRLPPSRGPAVEALAQWLGQVLDAPVDARAARTGLGMAPSSMAAFCYAPIQGLWLVFSLFAVVLAKDPLVRFSARQSLAYYLLSGIALVAVIVPLAAVAALLPSDDARGVAAVLLILVLLPLVFARLGLGLYAMFRAYKGEPWVIPGLGWLTRRWLPADEGGA